MPRIMEGEYFHFEQQLPQQEAQSNHFQEDIQGLSDYPLSPHQLNSLMPVLQNQDLEV